MSGGGKATFEQDWPELSRRLKGALSRRHVPSHLADDIIQETGFRLFKMWDDVDPERSTWGLTLTIAKNLLWDETHRRASRELLIDLPEHPTSLDVERAGIARMELGRVGRALSQMSSAHRSVLLAEIGDEVPANVTSPAAVKMMRMRARKRLTAILESASASSLAFGVGARKWAYSFQQFVRKHSTLVESPAPVAVAAVLGAVVVMAVPTTALPSPRQPANGDVPTQTQLVAHGNRTIDGWQGATEDLATSNSASATARKERSKEAFAPRHRYEVSFGDDTVGGSAQITIRESKRKEQLVSAPSCTTSDTQEGKKRVECHVDIRGERYSVELVAGLRP